MELTTFNNHAKQWQRWLKLAANQLFNQHCLLCHMRINTAPDFLLCHDCEYSLNVNETICQICSTETTSINVKTCGQCLTRTRYWDKCTSSYRYEPPLSNLIHQFKYQHQLRLKHTLCCRMIEKVKSRKANLPDLLIPVPMHSSRLASRGYNHSVILAQTFSQALSIPIFNPIRKSVNTPTQVSITHSSEHARHDNIKGSFKFKSNKAEFKIKQRHIAIIDDVVTTGATTSEIARVLKSADVGLTEVWCIART